MAQPPLLAVVQGGEFCTAAIHSRATKSAPSVSLAIRSHLHRTPLHSQPSNPGFFAKSATTRSILEKREKEIQEAPDAQEFVFVLLAVLVFRSLFSALNLHYCLVTRKSPR